MSNGKVPGSTGGAKVFFVMRPLESVAPESPIHRRELTTERNIFHSFLFLHKRQTGHILRGTRSNAQGDLPQMKKVIEVMLTVLALAGLYSGMPSKISHPGHSAVRSEQVVVIADGSDPMPLCHNKRCTQ